jgi:hypothetical protein
MDDDNDIDFGISRRESPDKSVDENPLSGRELAERVNTPGSRLSNHSKMFVSWFGSQEG